MKTTKVLSLAVLMAAMTGMTGITVDQAFASSHKGGNSEVGGVGPDGYKLQLIGIDKDDQFSNDETNNSKNIFVKLWGNTKIYLTPGEFDVIDWDGTDGVAAFQLPDPGDCDDLNFDNCTLEYSVQMRVLGNPNLPDGYGIVTCATEDGQVGGTATEDEVLCSVETIDADSSNGPGKKSKWTNVSKQLLTMCIDEDITTDSNKDADDIVDNDCDIRADLFDDRFIEYFWSVDANGHKLVQLLFKPTPVEA